MNCLQQFWEPIMKSHSHFSGDAKEEEEEETHQMRQIFFHVIFYTFLCLYPLVCFCFHSYPQNTLIHCSFFPFCVWSLHADQEITCNFLFAQRSKWSEEKRKPQHKISSNQYYELRCIELIQNIAYEKDTRFYIRSRSQNKRYVPHFDWCSVLWALLNKRKPELCKKRTYVNMTWKKSKQKLNQKQKISVKICDITYWANVAEWWKLCAHI